jgi:hypothetical protein
LRFQYLLHYNFLPGAIQRRYRVKIGSVFGTSLQYLGTELSAGLDDIL